jgi:hypothetical protein
MARMAKARCQKRRQLDGALTQVCGLLLLHDEQRDFYLQLVRTHAKMDAQGVVAHPRWILMVTEALPWWSRSRGEDKRPTKRSTRKPGPVFPGAFE